MLLAACAGPRWHPAGVSHAESESSDSSTYESEKYRTGYDTAYGPLCAGSFHLQPGSPTAQRKVRRERLVLRGRSASVVAAGVGPHFDLVGPVHHVIPIRQMALGLAILLREFVSSKSRRRRLNRDGLLIRPSD